MGQTLIGTTKIRLESRTRTTRHYEGHYSDRACGRPKRGSRQNADFIQHCTDAIALLGHATHELSMFRHRAICPPVNPRLCDEGIQITEHLFGDNLASALKDITEMDKISHKAMSGGRKGNNPKCSRFQCDGNGGNKKGSFLGTQSTKHFPARRGAFQNPKQTQGQRYSNFTKGRSQRYSFSQ